MDQNMHGSRMEQDVGIQPNPRLAQKTLRFSSAMPIKFKDFERTAFNLNFVS
jgi:hypothetical protein